MPRTGEGGARGGRSALVVSWGSWKTWWEKGGTYGYGSIPIHHIFSGMNIHLPAILGFTRYQRFDPSPYDNNGDISWDNGWIMVGTEWDHGNVMGNSGNISWQ
jgi:hypothetical protein